MISKIKEQGILELSGTPKQIEWANDIRSKTSDWVEKFIEKNCKGNNGDKKIWMNIGENRWEATSQQELLESLEYGLKNYLDANFWIKNRLKEQENLYLFLGMLRQSKKE